MTECVYFYFISKQEVLRLMKHMHTLTSLGKQTVCLTSAQSGQCRETWWVLTFYSDSDSSLCGLGADASGQMFSSCFTILHTNTVARHVHDVFTFLVLTLHQWFTGTRDGCHFTDGCCSDDCSCGVHRVQEQHFETDYVCLFFRLYK